MGFGKNVEHQDAVHIVVIAIAAAGLFLIPLVFGMIKYSIPGTIVSSILIVSIMSSSVDANGTNLFSFTAMPIAMGIFGFVAALLVVGRAVK